MDKLQKSINIKSLQDQLSGKTSSQGAGGVYQSSLDRWLAQQKEASGLFNTAASTLGENVQMFQPGGGYGAGQKTLLEDQARQAQAEALSSQVSSGMSSGSLATGTGLRVKKDLAQGLAGVEDTRTQFLAQALQNLAGLRTTQAQQVGTVTDPTYSPYMGYLSGAQQSSAALYSQQKQADLALTLQEMENKSAQAQRDWQSAENEKARQNQGTYASMKR